MTNDDLRALADALHWVQYTADWQTCDRAADYLRAQADAQPVALVRAYNAGYMAGHHDTVEGGFVDIHPSDMYTYHADVVAELGLPAAPQADALPVPAVPAGWKWVPVEPTPEMLVAARDWSIQKNGIAVGNDQATGCFQAMLAAAPAAPQAEPKREPLTYEQLVSACYTYRHDFGLLDPDEQELVIEEAGRWAKAFGIGGSDE